MDRFGVLWTRFGGEARKLADMVLTPEALRITKHPEAMAAGLPGPSLIHDQLGVATMAYRRDQWHHLPPQLEALLPPPNRDNPQRIILSRLLARQVEVRGMPPLEQEWAMLLFAGRNGLGHLDAFPSDAVAADYYARLQAPVVDDAGKEATAAPALEASRLWAAFRHLAEDTMTEGEDIDDIVDLAGPTPGISGFNPKLFAGLSLTGNDWGGGIGPGGLPAIVKIESPRYPGLLALESLAYALHRAADLPTPRTWLREARFRDEVFPVLAVERFDRDSAGHPLPLESVFSLLRTGAPGKFYDNTDGSLEDLWAALKMVSRTPREDRLHLFSRFALALLTGNGDLHLENWSVLGPTGQAVLSPVYDPAPMRAYRSFRANHDLLSALPFSGIGGTGQLPFANSGELPPDLGQRLIQFGEHLGLAKRRCRDRLAELLTLSADFPGQAIAALEALPADRVKPRAPDIAGFSQSLVAVHQALRAGLAVR